MPHHLRKCLFVMFLQLVTGCSALNNTACMYPDAPGTRAPAWVCGAPVDGVELSAVGFAEKTAAGEGFMKQMAINDANTKLAQGKGQHTIAPGKTVTREDLSRLSVVATDKSPRGGLYVLVGLKEADER